MKEILLFDMDNTVVDLESAVQKKIIQKYPEIQLGKRKHHKIEDDHLDKSHKAKIRDIIETPGFFLSMHPIEGAINGILDLARLYEIFFCTSPLLSNPTCANDKIAWVKKYLGDTWAKKIIITKDKTLVQGKFLVDDAPEVKGVCEPSWEHIIYTQEYNLDTIGKRRMSWEDYRNIF